MRELRKDGNFISREQLRKKRDADEAYEKRQKRLIAEMQGGREKKEYEKVKEWRRKGGKWRK